jgi:4-hydroxy-tetrahydrodipicolinate reductase
MKIVVCGAAGRMGQTIVNLAKEDSNFEIIAALEREGSKAIGTGNPAISSVRDLDKFLQEADGIIDFTNPESTLNNLEHAKKHNVPIIIGTTGFSEQQKQEVDEFSKSVAIVFSPNMSIGVNILFKLVEEAARKISDYDVEILELHHNKKKDAPSGTAAKLAEVVASVKCKKGEDIAVYGRHGANSLRTKDEVGVFSIRAGDIVGDHTVYFVGPGERIELTHRASSRDTFAVGALRAAKWIINQKPGLYDMANVLNLK